MTLYRTIDTFNEIETSEVLETDFSANAVVHYSASAAFFPTRDEAVAHKKKPLTRIADVAARLSAQATSAVTEFEVAVAAAPQVEEVKGVREK